ncbi:MAG: hypothetical protein ACE5GA_08360 [Candidatus Zixiibacteriota bacterium]
MRKTLLISGVLAALAFGALSCSNRPVDSDLGATPTGDGATLSPQQVKDLLVPTETQTRLAEKQVIWDALAPDEDIELWSPVGVDPASLSDQFHDIYSVRIVWGHLTHDGTPASVVTDWSGGITHNTAAMMVVRELIDFEHGQDSIFRAPSMPGIGWRSLVEDDIDGIHLVIFHPKDINYIAPPKFYIRTLQADIEIDLAQLANLDTIVAANADGQGLAVASHIVRDRDCPHGPLQGEWIFKNRGAGEFFGKWIASDGQPMGYLRGEFHTTEDGARLFRGKWFATDGDLQGYLRGEWGFSDHNGGPHIDMCPTCDWRVGWFRGHFTDTENIIRGRLGGKFGHVVTLDNGDHPGLFVGRWEVDCRHDGQE